MSLQRSFSHLSSTTHSLFGQLFACRPEVKGLSDFRFEARDGAVHTFRGGRAPVYTGDGQVVIQLADK